MADNCNLVITVETGGDAGLTRALEQLEQLQEDAARLEADLAEQGTADG